MVLAKQKTRSTRTGSSAGRDGKKYSPLSKVDVAEGHRLPERPRPLYLGSIVDLSRPADKSALDGKDGR